MDDPRHKNCLWMVSDGGKINLLSMKYLYRTMIKEVYMLERDVKNLKELKNKS